MNPKRARVHDCVSGVEAGTVISPGTGPQRLGLHSILCLYKKDGTVKTQFTVPNQRYGENS